MFGAQLLLGVTTEPLHAVVQGPGSAWRIGRTQFQHELTRCAAQRDSIGLYLHVTTTQLARSAACLRFHHIGPRLARWLQMTQDRANSDNFRVTHEFLAFMLGVRRVGVTKAASELQQQGLVDYRRGNISILKRRGLEKAACICYAADRRTYAALLKQRTRIGDTAPTSGDVTVEAPSRESALRRPPSAGSMKRMAGVEDAGLPITVIHPLQALLRHERSKAVQTRVRCYRLKACSAI